MNSNITFTTVFKSVEYVKKYLMLNYEKKGITNGTELAFKNGYSFVYYIKLGDTYFKQATLAPITIQPVLFFYGISHWLKGALLTVDPEYPATTQVLAHGVSTRKRKKQGYRFLSDEIKVQKDGFFPYLSNQLFNFKQLTGEKYKMSHLLMAIPELNETFKVLNKDSPLEPCEYKENNILVSNTLLRKLNFSPKRYELMVKEKTKTDITCIENRDTLKISLPKQNKHQFPLFKTLDGTTYIPAILPLYWRLPEILAHFLLLYNLSMICRYEAEWWGEVLYSYSSNDLCYIESFLSYVQQKTPYLMESLFLNEWN
ncbi:YaaC family protein [Evansella sp. AB-P1]|uniref:YaaC family protein n=1 Tax=Evansella sp. AB-P1 TaxID=3037653 RepID=UPI00241BF142|nr:YaaC family protein [Evansella sp. AB-P1]MDG5790128.1 YaaC family protein [Evansella sp. AB-P1]